MNQQTYLLVDLANTFFRSRHSTGRSHSIDEKVGMALHVTLSSINAVTKKFSPDHVVFCLEGRSWRKDFYEPYKRNRQVARAAMSPKEAEEEKLFWETYDNLIEYLGNKTNCSVIRCPTAEGDDIVARFIALHPDDKHVIISTDSDFVQLVCDNVSQYNGMSDELITVDGIFDSKDKPSIDKKTKLPKKTPDPAWALFEKIIRGDSTDNVFSAYPGVRTKGSKNKVGLTEAYADRHKQGWSWNNLMLQRWTDHEGNEHKVMDDFERNRVLIDLTAQPDDVKQTIDGSIREQVQIETRDQIGSKFLKFCGKYQLLKMSEHANQYSSWMSKHYTGHIS